MNRPSSTSVVDTPPAGSLPVGKPFPIAQGKRRNAKTPKRRKEITNSSPRETKDGWQERVQAHRKRQESVAKILNRTFGRFAKSNPDLWERRAYLMMVGLMYQWLATNEKEVSTEELVALSKVLAEQRRAEAQSRGSDEKETETVGPGGELPEDFGEAVKQVYGTNFQAPA
jgi:hypothetical protein